MKFVRRICANPSEGTWTSDAGICADLWELDSGNFAAIGKDVTDEAKDKLPPSAILSPGERIIELPRKLIVSAKKNIPEK